MVGRGAVFGILTLVLGGLVDYYITEPFFLQLVSTAPLTSLNALTAFLYLYIVPFAVSVAGAAAFIGSILGGTRRR